MLLNSEKQERLPAEVLRSRVSYDPSTGLMTWKSSRYQSMIGREIGGIHAPSGYRAVNFPEGRFLVHRLAWLYVYGEWPTEFLDHINCERSDNRIANLRGATQRQNMANRRAQGARSLKGITRHRGRWQAQIRTDGKNIFLGLFDSPEEAHAVYCARALEVHGKFARFK